MHFPHLRTDVQLSHTAAPHNTTLINLHVIQTHSALVLTGCHRSVDSCCHNAANNWRIQANVHCTLDTRLYVCLSNFGQHSMFVNLIQLQYVLPFSSTSKSLTIRNKPTHHALGSYDRAS